MFSMLVVDPSQCGKTHFVEQLLTKNCVKYPSKKPRRICWFYNQWQPRYASLKSTLGDEIHFTQGLPELSDDLHEINPKFNNVLVFDDLMSQATDSPVLSKLFTQGRHRDASAILLLQNMFPKGKFNTDISRNPQYMILFRSPSDRKQIDILAEQIFAKDRPNFMEAYAKETEKPYGYLLIDNQPKSTSDRQVVADVFGSCHSYPHMTTNTKGLQAKEISLSKQASEVEQENEASKVNVSTPNLHSRKRHIPHEFNQPRQKREKPANPQVKTKQRVKVTRKQSKSAKKQAKAKPNAEKKPRTLKKQATPNVYKTRFIVTPPRETLSSEEEEFNSEAEPFSSEDESLNATAKHLNFEDELNSLARQHKGFGPKIMYE